MEVFSNFNSKYIGALNPSNNTKTDYAVLSPIKQQSEQETLKSQMQTDSNGLTKALAGLAVIGAGVVGAAIYFKTKKKLPTDTLNAKNISSQATQTVSDFQKGVKKFFKTLITLEDVTNPKPSSEPIILALKRLNKTQENAYMIGDTILDIQAAISANITPLALTCGYGNENELKAHSMVFLNAYEAVNYIARLN